MPCDAANPEVACPLRRLFTICGSLLCDWMVGDRSVEALMRGSFVVRPTEVTSGIG